MLKFPISLIGQKDCQFCLNMISMQQIHGPKFFQMLGNRNYDLAPGNMFDGNRHMFELNDNQFVQNHLHSATIDSKWSNQFIYMWWKNASNTIRFSN